ncbi:DUF3054 domain-containing protein [Leucobacter sp. USHLN153]|uniref:DUF3054 domain-containing protein n=1 Tax=Leucobacter sp. USHLN153 TaxID=3081268 RepID=UPI0030163603
MSTVAPGDSGTNAAGGSSRSSETPPAQRGIQPLPVVIAAALDIAFVLIFATRGRITHSGSATIMGLLEVAWPFLVGLAVAWIVALVPRRPFAIVKSGIPVWLGTIAIGMILRALTGSGTAFSFILVATGLLGVCFIGWRGIALLVMRLRRPRG